MTHRSFAPWEEFGDLFRISQKRFWGDNRGFSLNKHSNYTPARDFDLASSRLHGWANISLGNDGFINDDYGQTSSQTIGHYNFAGAKNSIDCAPSRKEAKYKGNGDLDYEQVATFQNNVLEMRIEGSDPLIGFPIVAPDIDWTQKLSFSVIEVKGEPFLQVEGRVRGKNFPAYESFIEDAKGKKLFLYTKAVDGGRLDLASELIVNTYDHDEKFLLDIGIDDQGNFTDEIWSWECINCLNSKGESKPGEFGWKKYTVEEWNKIHSKKPPALDCDTGECGM